MNITRYFSLKDALNCAFNLNPIGKPLQENEITALQQTMLEMYDDILLVCNEHGYKPMLAGGTLLGAVRHNGFIPWDEDMDLAMSRKEYEEFKAVFSSKMNKKYILMAPRTEEGGAENFIKIFKKDTIYKKSLVTRVEPEYVSIDIFPIDFTPANRLVRKLKGIKISLLMGITSCVALSKASNKVLLEYSKTNRRVRNNINLRLLISKIVSFRSLQEWYNITDKSAMDSIPKGYCTSSFGRKHYFGESLPSEVYYPLKRTVFCGREAWMINKPSEYLSMLYGDYMVEPPKDKREHHFIVELQLGEM